MLFRSKFHCPSRRALVATGAAFSLASLAQAQKKKPAPKPAPKTEEKKPEEKKPSSWKVSQESVRYIDKGPTGGGAQVCMTCHYYIDPIECLVVEGYVSPLGWCDFYVD